MKRFAKISAIFCTGLVLLVFGVDLALGRFTAFTRGKHLVGREVYVAQAIARTPAPAVHTVFLGDSVARQVFPPGEEEDRAVKYLTTHQAISVAGQYYLLEEALAAHAAVKRVYLFYTPSAWANDWDQAFTHDYFCGYFHEPRHVREAFAVKRDWSLLGAHVGRLLLPNLVAANSSLSQSRTKPRRSWAKETEPRTPIEVSQVSQRFLARIRELCAARGIEFRVYPCPVSSQFSFGDDRGLYDAPISYLPRDNFHDDAIHLKGPYVARVRAEMAARFALPESVTRDESVPVTELVGAKDASLDSRL
jgi:hypothetical protein